MHFISVGLILVLLCHACINALKNNIFFCYIALCLQSELRQESCYKSAVAITVLTHEIYPRVLVFLSKVFHFISYTAKIYIFFKYRWRLTIGFDTVWVIERNKRLSPWLVFVPLGKCQFVKAHLVDPSEKTASLNLFNSEQFVKKVGEPPCWFHLRKNICFIPLILLSAGSVGHGDTHVHV